MRASLFAKLAAVLTVLGLFVAMAGPAGAMRPEKIYVDESFDENICGIDVHTTLSGFVTLHIQAYVIQGDDEDDNDFWIGVINRHLILTHTNADGVTLTNTIRDTVQEGDLVDLGDGYWLYTYAVAGQPERLRSGNQNVLVDVGKINFETVLYFGDLETSEDDEFISETITSIGGPHPDAESDFGLFCEVFTEIMG
jgi:hypothetical protein